jgi:hypothetical protein
MRIVLFSILWAVLFFAPQHAGDWYDLNFGLYQSLVSLSLIILASKLMDRGRHRRAMFSVLIIQILLNAFDSFAGLSYETYNGAQAALNVIEVMLIIDYTLWRMFCGKRDRNNSGTNSRGDFSPERLRGR